MVKSITLLLLFVGLLNAKPVSMEKAELAAKNWFAKTGKDQKSIANTRAATQNSMNAYYAVNFTGGGFVLVSGDDKVLPILAYSDNGIMPEKIENCALENWLQMYADQIVKASKDDRILSNSEAWEELLSCSLKANPSPVVSPLLTAHWNQDRSYLNDRWWNSQCPADPNGPNGHVLVGCVAVSLAQVMKYYSWPASGTNSNTYTPPGYPQQSVSFASQTYNWSAMPNDVSSEETEKLLYHCGVALDMQYGPNWSSAGLYGGSIDPNILNNPDDDIFHPTAGTFYALIHYFRYMENSLRYKEKDGFYYQYSYLEWSNLLKNELNNQRPIIYAGSDSLWQNGHAFNIDGYDNNNMFHMNWGWGGYADGYFTLDNLIPDPQYYPNYDYSYHQSAIIGIVPNTTDINEEAIEVKDLLVSNYPNPFNPETMINYTVPIHGFVKLFIYNAKGELVEEIVNSSMNAGSYVVKFDGSRLNSGVYFYKLECDGKSVVNKMMLIK